MDGLPADGALAGGFSLFVDDLLPLRNGRVIGTALGAIFPVGLIAVELVPAHHAGQLPPAIAVKAPLTSEFRGLLVL